MAQANDDNFETKQLKSLRDNKYALVKFESWTDRQVNVFWVDYQGGLVLYATLRGRESFEITTFETHPWVFRDATNDAVLVACGREVFLPKPWDGGDRTTVILHIPVYTLRQLCIEKIKAQKCEAEIRKLDIPRHLIPEMLQKKNEQYMVHVQF